MAQRISVGYHDYLPFKQYEGEPMPEIRVSTGTADVGQPYCLLQIGDNFDVYILRERLAELRDKITDYLGEESEPPEPDMNADKHHGDQLPESPAEYAAQKGRA
jgi:hypothetical protein